MFCGKCSSRLIAEESDAPPVADAGQDQVVQPHDIVTLNGIQSKDDKGIASYLWQPVGEIPFAVIEVRKSH